MQSLHCLPCVFMFSDVSDVKLLLQQSLPHFLLYLLRVSRWRRRHRSERGGTELPCVSCRRPPSVAPSVQFRWREMVRNSCWSFFGPAVKTRYQQSAASCRWLHAHAVLSVSSRVVLAVSSPLEHRVYGRPLVWVTHKHQPSAPSPASSQ